MRKPTNRDTPPPVAKNPDEQALNEIIRGDRRWHVVHGNGFDVLRWLGRELALPERAGKLPAIHIVTDPPYSEHVHKHVQTGKRNKLPDVVGADCRERRKADLEFEHITQPERDKFALLASAVVTRWAIVFSDVEGAQGWRDAFDYMGHPRYFRTTAWIRRGGAPHFQGDGPAPGHEEMIWFHAVKPMGQKRRWNSGGKRGIYDYPIVANRKGQEGSRVHPAQKPERLMAELIADVAEPGDLIVDPYCGSGTTGVAAVRHGCRFIGAELDRAGLGWPDIARTAIAAELAGSNLRHAMRGQGTLFG